MIFPKPKSKAYYRFKRVKDLLNTKSRRQTIGGLSYPPEAIDYIIKINPTYVASRYYGEIGV